MILALIAIPNRSADIPPLWPVRVLRYALPLALFIVVTVFEAGEHWVEAEFLFIDRLGVFEIFIFGVVGPYAVFLTMTYVDRLLHEVDQARARFIALNNDLEQTITQRTTALQTTNEELAQANHRLREVDQMKSDFVALVSHELRAPLATLNGGLEVALQDEAVLPPKAQRILRLLSSETQRLTRFVQTLLDVSQLEAGKLQLTRGPVAVRPMLMRGAEVVLGQDAGRVVWQLPRDLPPILADETYAEQIVRNLLRNALKYTPPHSPIELSATVHVRTVQICVTDHGPGISPVEQARVFERFYRTHNGDECKASGWGLGLYYARALTEAQGGTLTVQSPVHANPDAPGARFTITLPIAEEGPDNGETLAD